MNKIIAYSSITIYLLCLIGCIGKDDEPFVNGKITFELLSGGNQTEKIGRNLPKSIKLKVLKDGVIAAGTKVVFKAPTCNGTEVVQKQVAQDGTVEYTWRMTDVVGQQKLVVYAYIDRIPYDSITVSATATDVDKRVLNVSSCLPYNAYSASFRIYTGNNKTFWTPVIINNVGRMYVSKNSGQSWTLAPNFHGNFSAFLATKNAIYWVKTDSLISSKDDGATRSIERLPSEFKNAISSPFFNITNSGRYTASYLAPDNSGYAYVRESAIASWVKPSGIDYISKLVETSSGRLICVGRKNGKLNTSFYYSDDAGLSWKPTTANENVVNYDQSYYDHIFVNSKNEIYLFAWSQSKSIYKSTDNGNSWVFVKNLNNPLFAMSEYNNQMYFLEGLSWQNAVYKTSDFVTNQLIESVNDYYLNSFHISADGFLVLPFKDNIYYRQL